MDHGVSGTTATGAAIACEDKIRWRWEPTGFIGRELITVSWDFPREFPGSPTSIALQLHLSPADTARVSPWQGGLHMGNGSALRRCGLAADLVALFLLWDSIGGRPPPGAELQTISVSQLGEAAMLALLGMTLQALANRARDRTTSDLDRAPDTHRNTEGLPPCADLARLPPDAPDRAPFVTGSRRHRPHQAPSSRTWTLGVTGPAVWRPTQSRDPKRLSGHSAGMNRRWKGGQRSDPPDTAYDLVGR